MLGMIHNPYWTHISYFHVDLVFQPYVTLNVTHDMKSSYISMNTCDRRVPVLGSDHVITLHDHRTGFPLNPSRIGVRVILILEIEIWCVKLNVVHDMKSSILLMNTVDRRVPVFGSDYSTIIHDPWTGFPSNPSRIWVRVTFDPQNWHLICNIKCCLHMTWNHHIFR